MARSANLPALIHDQLLLFLLSRARVRTSSGLNCYAFKRQAFNHSAPLFTAKVVTGTRDGQFNPKRAGFATQKMPKSFEAAEGITGARGYGTVLR